MAPPDLAIVQAQRVTRQFLDGSFLTVSRKRAPKAKLKQMDGVDEIWTLCLREHKPGMRILCRFIERDTLIGLSIVPRKDLAASFQPAIERWNEKLSAAPMVRSTELSDYLSDLDMCHEL